MPPATTPDLTGRGRDTRGPETVAAATGSSAAAPAETQDFPVGGGPRRPFDPAATLSPAAGPPGRGDPGRFTGYELLDELGRGGMGVVYRARQTQLNRLVALKMIRGGDAGPQQAARFQVEAEAVARLRHPNIVQIYDVGEYCGSPFVALELLEGGCLADRLAGTPQPGRAAAALLAILAGAMEAAHRAGIVHRDLKPANVLFAADGAPKVADFGLAKRLELHEGQTVTGQVMGTPSDMAPEQAGGEGHRITPATDVYAPGAILYEMLTGRPPFKGPTTRETVRQVVETDPVPPSRLQPRVPRDLETVCLKCLAKGPAKRYPSAQALADDLARYLAGEPVRARRTPWWERGVMWARRHPTAATLMALTAAAVAVAATAGLRYDAANRRRARPEGARVARVGTTPG